MVQEDKTKSAQKQLAANIDTPVGNFLEAPLKHDGPDWPTTI
jgi:hypothetical protein